MKKVVKLTESDISNMVMEVVNEIGYKTMRDAANASEYLGIGNYDKKYGTLTKSCSGDVADAISIIEDALDDSDSRFYNTNKKPVPFDSQLSKAQSAIRVIRDFFTRKQKQANNIISNFQDRDTECEKEFISVLKKLYPQAINQEGTWIGRINYDVLTDEMVQDVRSRVSPQTQDYIDQEGYV